jgi:nucleotide-binding universal stress UspA family protein
MRIVSGIDFSPNSLAAAEAAAAIARRLGEELILVHADAFLAELPESGRTAWLEPMRGRLRATAERLRQAGTSVSEEILTGPPDERLTEYAAKIGARLIVVSSLGRRPPEQWLLGSVAERTAQTATVPVLVVRNAAPFASWARGERPLRVLLAVDLSPASEAAIRWVRELQDIGPCHVVVAHSCWPPRERERLGIHGPMPLTELDPEVERVLRRDLASMVGGSFGSGERHLRVEMCLGRADTHLVAMATDEQADLVVVGTRQRRGVDRFWHGSVSRGVLHLAPMSVACVPTPTPLAQEPPAIPVWDTVLAATDLSDLGNRAVASAYAVLPRGGIVYLAHVLDEVSCEICAAAGVAPTSHERDTHQAEIVRRLSALVPADAETRGIQTRLEIVRGKHVAEALCAAAERLGVDLLCLGPHGRSGLSKAVLGSVAHAVLRRSRRPVLVVPPPRAT